jgi:hypothetical protein
MEVLTVIKKMDRKKRFWKWNSSFKNYQSLYLWRREKRIESDVYFSEEEDDWMSGVSEYWKQQEWKLCTRKEETANWTEGNQQSLIIQSKERVYNLKVEKPDVRTVRTDGKVIVQMNVVYSIR